MDLRVPSSTALAHTFAESTHALSFYRIASRHGEPVSTHFKQMGVKAAHTAWLASESVWLQITIGT
ncbi:secretory pathway Sec39 family protein [Paraburkholderia sp. CNPSo 3281]|uniref:secretory pathway Sec39 family protein n=1 Tax=Paraburkholderia sp. CNPSo 3281 TaxID=2940933 RepID=UPI0020B816B8|nr:secretory pathway Sec39 family protein [Paraburkholderia sp. CNPSo 3281]MCP3720537.1 secretory pathway Sec39 family protein [Paraburkholderia sp. CNPSo 3281]